jgi:hypothetical protein
MVFYYKENISVESEFEAWQKSSMPQAFTFLLPAPCKPRASSNLSLPTTQTKNAKIF